MSTWVSGIDIGHMAIRAVVMRRVKGVWKIHEHGQVDRFYGASDKSLRQELQELTTKVALKGPVYVSDSGMNIMVRYISSVPLPSDRLQRLVRLDLQQHADDSGDLAADMMVLPVAGDELVVCCPLAQPVQVRELLYELKRVRITAQAVCLPAASSFNALCHQLVNSNEDAQPGYYLMLDVGAKQTRLILSRGDEFLACRSLPFGGWDFTNALTNGGQRSVQDAEKLKVSGLASKSSVASLSQKTTKNKRDETAQSETVETKIPLFDDDENSGNKENIKSTDDGIDADSDNLFDDDEIADTRADVNSKGNPPAQDELSFTAFETDELLIDTVDTTDALDNADASGSHRVAASLDFFDEGELPAPGAQTKMIGAVQLGDDLVRVAEQLHVHIASSLKWFKAQLGISDMEIEKVFLCGASNKLVGLIQYLEHRMHKPVVKISFDPEMHEQAMSSLSGYTTAVGAALQIEKSSLQFDLRTESVLRKEAWWREVVWQRVAAVFLCIAGLLWVISVSAQQQMREENSQALIAHQKLRDGYIAELQTLQKDRDNLYEDLRGIAGRIYAGRDLLNAVRALKEEAPRDLWVITFRTENINNEKDDTDRRGNPGSAIVTHSDTVVDRGSIYVSGRGIPQENLPVSELHNQVDKWIQGVTQWKEDAADENSVPIFKSSRKVRSSVERKIDRKGGKKTNQEERVFIFEVKFDFQETSMKNVTVADAPADSKFERADKNAP